MKYFKRIWGKMPFSANRRNISQELKIIWKSTPIFNKSQQSTGSLYEQFISSTQKDIHKWHHYFDIYEQHLRRFVGTPVRFLEIGVFKGGSLRMWRDYLGANAIIVGIDIDKSCARFDGIHAVVRIGDQCDKDFLAKICDEFGPFDIILDDGGHVPSQQIASFCFLYPLLSERGVYICEDTHMNYWSKRQDLGRKRTFVNFAKTIADHLTEPFYKRKIWKDYKTKNWNRFKKHPDEREGELRVSYIAASTHSVHFYDSVIAIERRTKAEPFLELR